MESMATGQFKMTHFSGAKVLLLDEKQGCIKCDSAPGINSQHCAAHLQMPLVHLAYLLACILSLSLFFLSVILNLCHPLTPTLQQVPDTHNSTHGN